MRAPETGRTDTISARLLITPMMIIPAHAKAITQPAEPEIPMSSPEVMNKPMPIVPENAIAKGSVRPEFQKHASELACNVVTFKSPV